MWGIGPETIAPTPASCPSPTSTVPRATGWPQVVLPFPWCLGLAVPDSWQEEHRGRLHLWLCAGINWGALKKKSQFPGPHPNSMIATGVSAFLKLLSDWNGKAMLRIRGLNAAARSHHIMSSEGRSIEKSKNEAGRRGAEMLVKYCTNPANCKGDVYSMVPFCRPYKHTK